MHPTAATLVREQLEVDVPHRGADNGSLAQGEVGCDRQSDLLLGQLLIEHVAALRGVPPAHVSAWGGGGGRATKCFPRLRNHQGCCGTIFTRGAPHLPFCQTPSVGLERMGVLVYSFNAHRPEVSTPAGLHGKVWWGEGAVDESTWGW